MFRGPARWQRHVRRALAGTAALATASCGASVLLSEDRDPLFVPKVAVRSLRTVAVGAAIVADYEWSLHGLAEGSPERARALQEAHERSAHRMLRAIRKNGGVYVKFGQHIAALEYLLPIEYSRTMRVLQDRCHPSDRDEIDRMFRKETGRGINETFKVFDDVPLGVASLAQVHRAVLKDGREVAIKIQHPSIRPFSMVDIELTTGFVRLVKVLFPLFEFEWLALEMRSNLPLELNFEHEADNADRLRDLFASSRLAFKVPLVYWATPRLLCMEFIHGERIDNLEYLKAQGISPRRVACELTRAFSDMIFRHGFLHADPHPGNVLVQPRRTWQSYVPILRQLYTGRNFSIVLLDHGLYRNLDEDIRVGYASMWRALIRRDEHAIRHWSKRLARVDMYHLFACMLTGRSWNTILQQGVETDRDIGELQVLSDNAGMFFTKIATVLAQVPRPLLLIFKTNDLLRSVCRSLNLSEWAFISVMSNAILELSSSTSDIGSPGSADIDDDDGDEDGPSAVRRSSPWTERVICALQKALLQWGVWCYEIGVI